MKLEASQSAQSWHEYRFKTYKFFELFSTVLFPSCVAMSSPPTGIVDVALALLTAETMLRTDGPQLVIVVYAGGAHIRNQAGTIALFNLFI